FGVPRLDARTQIEVLVRPTAVWPGLCGNNIVFRQEGTTRHRIDPIRIQRFYREKITWPRKELTDIQRLFNRILGSSRGRRRARTARRLTSTWHTFSG